MYYSFLNVVVFMSLFENYPFKAMCNGVCAWQEKRREKINMIVMIMCVWLFSNEQFNVNMYGFIDKYSYNENFHGVLPGVQMFSLRIS